jgi:hypothetical protein
MLLAKRWSLKTGKRHPGSALDGQKQPHYQSVSRPGVRSAVGGQRSLCHNDSVNGIAPPNPPHLASVQLTA